jgi:hypothetical protein
MPKLALFVRLEAKPGKEAEVVKFLETGLALVRQLCVCHRRRVASSTRSMTRPIASNTCPGRSPKPC